MKKLLAVGAALFATALFVETASAQYQDCQCDECPRRPRLLALGHRHAEAQPDAGYRGPAGAPGYAGPEAYGYWADYGWFGPQYGAWYGPGGWNYYSRTGDYAAPFLPPPSMRGPSPY